MIASLNRGQKVTSPRPHLKYVGLQVAGQLGPRTAQPVRTEQLNP